MRMANFDLYEIEEFVNENTVELTTKIPAKTMNRKWREIENFKENRRLHKELLQYSQYEL